METIGASGSSQWHVDVRRVDYHAVCHSSAINPDQTPRVNLGFENLVVIFPLERNSPDFFQEENALHSQQRKEARWSIFRIWNTLFPAGVSRNAGRKSRRGERDRK